MMAIIVLGEIIAILGLISSLLLLYLVSTSEGADFERMILSWNSFSMYFIISAIAFALISISEALEFISSIFSLDIEELIEFFNLMIGGAIVVITVNIIRILIKIKENIANSGTSVFYGRFGITILYIAVFLLSVYHIKDSGKVCNYVTYLSEIIYIALFPALVYIIVRSKKYNELIKKGTIAIPPHTPNIFLSIAVSFILFFLAILMLFTGNEETYNILEAGALFAFVLVGYSYGRDMEKALKASS